MFQGNYVSVRTLIENIQRDIDYDNELNIYEVSEWAWKAMDLIGAKVAMEQKEVTLTVEDYVVAMPHDFKSLNAVRRTDDNISMTPSSDNFMKDNTSKSDIPPVAGFTYRIDNKFLFTDFEEGDIVVSYNSIKIDDEGLPMIPDETRYTNAVESYVIYKLDLRMYRKGIIPRAIYEESKQRWFFQCKSAHNKMVTPDENKAELIMRSRDNMLGNKQAHNSGFRTLNIRTINKNH